MSWHKYLLIPKLMWYGMRASRDNVVAWDRFWACVQRTGPGGDVLWDAGSDAEIAGALGQLRPHLDPTLPIVDVGCGNGRYTRLLASLFPQALGIDVSTHALAKARDESRNVANVSYRVQDVGRPEVGRQLATELGELN